MQGSSSSIPRRHPASKKRIIMYEPSTSICFQVHSFPSSQANKDSLFDCLTVNFCLEKRIFTIWRKVTISQCFSKGVQILEWSQIKDFSDSSFMEITIEKVAVLNDIDKNFSFNLFQWLLKILQSNLSNLWENRVQKLYKPFPIKLTQNQKVWSYSKFFI